MRAELGTSGETGTSASSRTLGSKGLYAGVDAHPKERWEHLDGLRGIAAVIVVLCHFVLAFQPALGSGNPAQGALATATGLSRTLLTIFWNGDFAVTTFFVLSGFVLSLASARAPEPNQVRRFAGQLARRWLRLAGPILASSLLVWAVLEAGWAYNKQAAALNGSTWIDMHYGWTAWEPNSLLILVRQSTFDIFTSGEQWWNAALWTMPIEFVGSLGVFAFYALLRSAPRHIRLVALISAAATLCATNYLGFAAGALLWEARPSAIGVGRATRAGGACALLMAIVLGGMPYDLMHTAYWPLFVFLSAHVHNAVAAAHRAGAILMVAAVLWLPLLQRVMMSRLPQALGRVSFMVYLCHIVVLCSLASWLVIRLTPLVGYDLATAAALLATGAILAPLAVLMTRLADTPSIVLSRRFERLVLAAVRWRLPGQLWRRCLLAQGSR